MKVRSSFVCQQCGNETPQWLGKCPSCGEWNTLVETTKVTGKSSAVIYSQSQAKPQSLNQIKSVKKDRLLTQLTEFDRVLGGGIIPGATVLIAGDPGVGKSTLLLTLLGHIGGLYVTGEESAEQVKLRAERLNINQKELYVLPEINIETILSSFSQITPKPLVIVIDSIQTMYAQSLEGAAGSVGQIRECTQKLIQFAKREQTAVFIVGHVTKEGTIAGPKLLEHMVDIVCYFEGDRYYQGRVLRTFKNRFGPTDEVGIFEMEEQGLKEVSNPSKLFIETRIKNQPGSAVGVTLEGTRPLLIEIQSLIVPTQLAIPRRVVNGIDYNRLQVILAVLQKRLNLPLGNFDVFVNVSGGLRLKEPALDLTVALSLVSAFKNRPLVTDLASFGELGLLGELRRVQGEDKRIKEAKRLGFNLIVSPQSCPTLEKASQITIRYVK